MAGLDTELIERLRGIVGEGGVLLDEPMSEHTTFRIGGPADVMVVPSTEAQAIAALRALDEVGAARFVMGNGSDLLVSDEGVRGATVLLRQNLSVVEVDGTTVRAEAGALMRDVALAAAAAGLTGLEPLWGIPTTIGGACFMNAGAYEGQTSDHLVSVTAYGPDGRVRSYGVDELRMGYRASRVAEEGLVVLDATFELAPAARATIEAAMAEFQRRREEKQPLEMPSAGSTFKRPAGHFAGKLIMDAGLRGVRMGGAQVSEKHCGFVVNTGDATATEVDALIRHIQDEVEERFGVHLDPEVRRIGAF